MNIEIIVPITTKGFRPPEEFSQLGGRDTSIGVSQIRVGPQSIESEFEEALAAVPTAEAIVDAAEAGADAAVIDCMGDPGLRAARERVGIPVMGPCETSMHMAAMLGHRFSVLTVLDRLRPQFERRSLEYGVESRLASVRSVEIPVLDLHTDRDRTLKELVSEAQLAITRDHADVLIFGCTGMMGLAGELAVALGQEGFGDVPVLDPVPLAVATAEALVTAKLSHSKRCYPSPK